MHHPTDRIAHTTAFVTPVVEHWLEREIAQRVHPMKDRSDDPLHHEQMLLSWSYISLLKGREYSDSAITRVTPERCGAMIYNGGGGGAGASIYSNDIDKRYLSLLNKKSLHSSTMCKAFPSFLLLSLSKLSDTI